MKFYRPSVKIIDVIRVCVCKERKISKTKPFHFQYPQRQTLMSLTAILLI